jgi:hypothetical protein
MRCRGHRPGSGVVSQGCQPPRGCPNQTGDPSQGFQTRLQPEPGFPNQTVNLARVSKPDSRPAAPARRASHLRQRRSPPPAACSATLASTSERSLSVWVPVSCDSSTQPPTARLPVVGTPGLSVCGSTAAPPTPGLSICASTVAAPMPRPSARLPRAGLSLCGSTAAALAERLPRVRPSRAGVHAPSRPRFARFGCASSFGAGASVPAPACRGQHAAIQHPWPFSRRPRFPQPHSCRRGQPAHISAALQPFLSKRWWCESLRGDIARNRA